MPSDIRHLETTEMLAELGAHDWFGRKKATQPISLRTTAFRVPTLTALTAGPLGKPSLFADRPPEELRLRLRLRPGISRARTGKGWAGGVERSIRSGPSRRVNRSHWSHWSSSISAKRRGLAWNLIHGIASARGSHAGPRTRLRTTGRLFTS